MPAGKPCRDHLGHEYKSESAMCKAHGVTRDTFIRRRASGMPLADALSPVTAEAPGRGKPRKACDHTGQEFRSLTEMCRKYGVSKTTYRGRMALGWSVEKALTTPEGQNKKAAATADGMTLPSLRALQNFYGMSKDRRRQTFASKDAIMRACAHDWHGRTFGCYQGIQAVALPWFKAREHGKALVIVHFGKLHQTYLYDNPDAIPENMKERIYGERAMATEAILRFAHSFSTMEEAQAFGDFVTALMRQHDAALDEKADKEEADPCTTSGTRGTDA